MAWLICIETCFLLEIYCQLSNNPSSTSHPWNQNLESEFAMKFVLKKCPLDSFEKYFWSNFMTNSLSKGWEVEVGLFDSIFLIKSKSLYKVKP